MRGVHTAPKLGNHHLSKYLLQRYYGKGALARGLGEQERWLETFEAAAKSYDNLPAATSSEEILEWIQGHTVVVCQAFPRRSSELSQSVAYTDLMGLHERKIEGGMITSWTLHLR